MITQQRVLASTDEIVIAATGIKNGLMTLLAIQETEWGLEEVVANGPDAGLEYSEIKEGKNIHAENGLTLAVVGAVLSEVAPALKEALATTDDDNVTLMSKLSRVVK